MKASAFRTSIVLTSGTYLLSNVGESEVTIKLSVLIFSERRGKNVRLDDADVVLAKLLLSSLSGDGGRNDNIVTRKPVDGGGDALLVGGLESLDDTENFGGVTASGGRVCKSETDLLGRVNDEDGTDGKGEAYHITLESFLQSSRGQTHPSGQRWWCLGSQACRKGRRSCGLCRR